MIVFKRNAEEIKIRLNYINLQVLALNYMMAGNALLNGKMIKKNVIEYLITLDQNILSTAEKFLKTSLLTQIIENNALMLKEEMTKPNIYR